jgi:hypothetical protein
MERGSEVLEPVALDDAVEKLLENTDDAYGFPPFALFAPMIKIDGLDYQALRRREAELLRSAIAGAARWHLRVEGHEWAERLPSIIDKPPLVAVGPGFDGVDTPAGSARDDVGVGIPVGPGVGGGTAESRPSVFAGPSHIVSVDAASPPDESGGGLP